MNFLTDEERCSLKSAHKKEQDRRVCDRIKAVLLHDKGWSPSRIAEALLLTEGAIRNHIDEYKTSQKLKPQNGGSEEKLSRIQSEELKRHLEEHTYLYVKDIVGYVFSKWKVVYTVHGMRDWLKRHGFSYKKPSLVPGKANKELQEEWLKAMKS